MHVLSLSKEPSMDAVCKPFGHALKELLLYTDHHAYLKPTLPALATSKTYSRRNGKHNTFKSTLNSTK